MCDLKSRQKEDMHDKHFILVFIPQLRVKLTNGYHTPSAAFSIITCIMHSSISIVSIPVSGTSTCSSARASHNAVVFEYATQGKY